jgi:hypothetical protein
MTPADDQAYLLEESRRFRTGLQAPNHASDQAPKGLVGAIGNMYARKQLSPPFHTSDYVKRWLTAGIPPEHFLEQVRKHLKISAHLYRCGSGDKGIDWLDALIHSTWHKRSVELPEDAWDHPETWIVEP